MSDVNDLVKDLVEDPLVEGRNPEAAEMIPMSRRRGYRVKGLTSRRSGIDEILQRNDVNFERQQPQALNPLSRYVRSAESCTLEVFDHCRCPKARTGTPGVLARVEIRGFEFSRRKILVICCNILSRPAAVQRSDLK